ncbi:hypothetical protein Vretimale_18773 [Volvox reticuliferus]|nr:hypothetical protein Vretimale_18773 [Volvox reticuliferus]
MVAFESWRSQYAVRVLNWMTTCIFSLDILVHFRTAYITQTGELIRTPRLIAVHYTRGMLLLDLVSALPLEEIVSMATLRQSDSPRQVHMYWLGILRLPRLFHLARHLKILTPLKLLNLMAVIKLIFIMVMITHWSACLWYYLSQELHDWPWIYGIRCAGWSDRDIYLFAFYRCFLLILGDKPDTYNDVERIFAVCLLSMGACMYAIVMGGVTMLVNNMWGMESRHKQRAVMMQDALRYKGAKDGLRARVHDHFIFMQRFDHPGMEGLPLLSELPSALHAEVMSSVFKPFLLKVQLFAYCEQPFISRLAQRLRMLLYMPGNLMYDVDDVGHEMYIIWKGNVALLEPDGSMAALLGQGDHFGELGVMNVCTPRPHRAIALRATDVVVLSRSDVQDAMTDFPESAQLVKNRAMVQLEDHEIGHSMLSAALAARETAGQQESQSQTASDSDDMDSDDDSQPGNNVNNVGNDNSSASSIDDTPCYPLGFSPEVVSTAGIGATPSATSAGEAAAVAADESAPAAVAPPGKLIHRCWDEKATESRDGYYFDGKARHSGGDSSSQEPDNSREDSITVPKGMGTCRPHKWQANVPEHSTDFALVSRSISLTSLSNVKQRIIRNFVERKTREPRGQPVAGQGMKQAEPITKATNPSCPGGDMGALPVVQEAGASSGGSLLGHRRRSLIKHVVLAPAGMPSSSSTAAIDPSLERNSAALPREDGCMDASCTQLPADQQSQRTIATSISMSARPRHPNVSISTSSTTARRGGPDGGQGFPPLFRQLQRARTINIASSHVDMGETASEATAIVTAALPRANSFSSRILSDPRVASIPGSAKMTHNSTPMLTSIDKLQLADGHDGTGVLTSRQSGEFSCWQPSQESVEQQHTGHALLQSMMLMPPQPQFLGLDPLAAVMTHHTRSGSPEPTTVGVGLWRRKLSGVSLQQNPLVLLADTGMGMMKENDTIVTSSATVALAMALEGRRSQGRMGMIDARRRGSSSSVTAAALATLDDSNINGRNNGPCDMIVHGWLESQTGQQQSASGGSQKARLLEQHLAQTQKKLAETEARLESLMQNPLQIPAMQAALSRAVSDVAVKLSTKVEIVLKKLSDALQGVVACTHDLSRQISNVDDRLQRLEEEKDGGFGAIGGLGKPLIPRPGYRKSPSGSGSVLSMTLEAPSTEIEDLSPSLQASPFTALVAPVSFNTQHGNGSTRISTPRLTRTMSLAHAGSLGRENSSGGGSSSRLSLVMRLPALRPQISKPGMTQRSSGFFAGLRNPTFAAESRLSSETESCSKANSTIIDDDIDTLPASDSLIVGDQTGSSGKQHPGTAPGMASSVAGRVVGTRTLRSQSSYDPPRRACDDLYTAGVQLQQQQIPSSQQQLTPPSLLSQQQQE